MIPRKKTQRVIELRPLNMEDLKLAKNQVGSEPYYFVSYHSNSLFYKFYHDTQLLSFIV